MRAIVLGATGLVGSSLVQQLCANERVKSVVAITRRPVNETADAGVAEKLENRVIDFDQLVSTSQDYVDIFSGDVLFSCLGTTLKQAGSIKAQRVVDYDYQYQAASLASAAGVKHYLLVSSSGANANSLSQYLKMKGELEAAIQVLNFQHISIVQPSLLLGKRAESRFAEGLGSLVLPLLCKLPGLTAYRPIYAQQVAAKLVELSLLANTPFERLTLDEVFPAQDIHLLPKQNS